MSQTIEGWRGNGLKLEDVPEAPRRALKPSGSWSTGGTSIDRTDEIHPDNVEIARQAAMVVGLDVAGIDFITPDIARSVREQRGAIVEVNQSPGPPPAHPSDGRGCPRCWRWPSSTCSSPPVSPCGCRSWPSPAPTARRRPPA